jgi:hypothetical protein
MPRHVLPVLGLLLAVTGTETLAATLDLRADATPYGVTVYTVRSDWEAAVLGRGKRVFEGFENPDLTAAELANTDSNGDINITRDLTFTDSGVQLRANRYDTVDMGNNDFELRPDYDENGNQGVLFSIENTNEVTGEPSDKNDPVEKMQPDTIALLLPDGSTAFSISIGLGEQTSSQGIGNDSGTRISLDTGPLSVTVMEFDPDRLAGGDGPGDPSYVGFLGFVTDEQFDRIVFTSGAENFSNNDDDFLVDNLDYTKVPLPPALALLAGALGCAAYLARRREGGAPA